ncbi:ribbon-helix-helix protein, CopG family [Microlunatus speluncae]|uniref:ribbon-helix-helix protein, CopG family n=1 Tax=Microlunatus speluncae TaxID=2594267 RepID=UPI00126688BF|nr:ribbon-helix-helix protein, CopG family [Microlunatus speluncae]
MPRPTPRSGPAFPQTSGKRTNTAGERAEQIAEESLAEIRRRNLVPGGKSMSGGAKHSPVVQFRVPETMEEALDAQAEREGMTRSRLARKALDEYLERHAG